MADYQASEEKSEGVLGDLQTFAQKSLASLVKATQKANQLPAPGEDHEFYYSFSNFRAFRATQGTRLLTNIGNLLRHGQIGCGWSQDGYMDTEDMFDCLVEANDILLEQVDNSLDEAAGLSRNKKPVLPAGVQQSPPVVSSWNMTSKGGKKRDANFRFLHAKNILRPQLKFRDKPDNSNTPFVPIIKYKPNALKPLHQGHKADSRLSEDPAVPSALADFIHQQRIQTSSETYNSTEHPYQYELESWEPKEDQLQTRKEQLYLPLEETSLTYVDTEEQLQELVNVLREVKEFAVDLEHHSYRSFQGFVCLMQISTRERDFLVDTLELRSELAVLNEVFTDTNILKVFHGADMDVGWLQRDFGIYVVNMFDTGQASRVLGLERFSLAFLLKTFCNVTANKQYQLADWRIRPLPAEMKRYAREDTHYLLYIYDRLRNELIKKGNVNNNLLISVYKRSRDVCLKRYEKLLFRNDSYMDFYNKQKRTLNPQQLSALRLLYQWRDGMAREEDESYGYVLPNHMMFHIAEQLPRDAQGVLACCNPIPTLVKQHVNVIHMLIMEAKETPTSQVTHDVVSSTAESSSNEQVGSGGRRSYGVTLPSQKSQFSTTFINGDTSPTEETTRCVATGPPVILVKPVISVFDYPTGQEQLTEGEEKARRIQASISNPFEGMLPAKKPVANSSRGGETEETQSRANVNEINKRWKETSLADTDDIVEKGNIEDTPVTGGKRKRDEEQAAEGGDSEAEDTTPLREKPSYEGRKKKKKRKMGTQSQDSTSVSERVVVFQEPRGNQDVTKATKEFSPFDYSSTDYRQINVKPQDKTSDAFSPYDKSSKDKVKNIRSKVHMKSGQRSVTYSKKRDSSLGQKWPKQRR